MTSAISYTADFTAFWIATATDGTATHIQGRDKYPLRPDRLLLYEGRRHDQVSVLKGYLTRSYFQESKLPLLFAVAIAIIFF